jgi:hypothetical protein
LRDLDGSRHLSDLVGQGAGLEEEDEGPEIAHENYASNCRELTVDESYRYLDDMHEAVLNLADMMCSPFFVLKW